MENQRILIISADVLLGQQLEDQLRTYGFDLIHSDAEDFLEALKNKRPNLILACTYHRRIEDCLLRVRQIRRQEALIPIIMLTRYSSESRAIAAFRAGVNDYHKIPLPIDTLLNSIRQYTGTHLDSSPDQMITDIPACKPPCPVMIGQSRSIQEIKAYLGRVAATDSTVFITGETGTGKELAAEMVHRSSSRQDHPFVRINCAAIPEGLAESEIFGHERGAFTGAVTAKPGKFALANGGSVLLDEIGDMCTVAQAKILRTIEHKEVSRLGGKNTLPVDVRVIAATNQDPEDLMSTGKFRKDLYYRLNVARVQLPPFENAKKISPICCITL